MPQSDTTLVFTSPVQGHFTLTYESHHVTKLCITSGASSIAVNIAEDFIDESATCHCCFRICETPPHSRGSEDNIWIPETLFSQPQTVGSVFTCLSPKGKWVRVRQADLSTHILV